MSSGKILKLFVNYSLFFEVSCLYLTKLSHVLVKVNIYKLK